MKNILSGEGADVLARFARTPTLLAFDFDGTLAPIVAARDSARMRPGTAALLSALTELFPTAVISGRSRQDLAGRLAGAAVKHLVGNHGLEPAPHMPAFEQAVAQMRPQLCAELQTHGGIEIEDKRYSLAIHYRKARAKRETRAAILRATAGLPRAPRIVLGKAVVNLLPEGAPHKGVALESLLETEQAQTAIYVGDDVTDEDVFALQQPERILGIRVGRSRASAARWFVRDQAGVDTLLERLIALRKDAPAF